MMLNIVYRVIKSNQKSWLRPCIDINTDLRKAGKIDFEKYFFKLMNYSVFGKAMYEKCLKTHFSQKICWL